MIIASGAGDLGSIPVRVIPKTQKWYLMLPSVTRQGSRVKWNNPGKGVASSPKPWCSSYRKRSLLVTLDNCCQLYFIITAISFDLPLKNRTELSLQTFDVICYTALVLRHPVRAFCFSQY